MKISTITCRSPLLMYIKVYIIFTEFSDFLDKNMDARTVKEQKQLRTESKVMSDVKLDTELNKSLTEYKLLSEQKIIEDENNLSELDKSPGNKSTTECLEKKSMPKIALQEPGIILARTRRHFSVQDEVVLILSADMVQYIVDSWEGEPCRRTVFINREPVPKDDQEDKPEEESPVEDTVNSPDGKPSSARQSPNKAETTEQSSVKDKGKKRKKKGAETGSIQELRVESVVSYRQADSTLIKKRGGKERKVKEGHRSLTEYDLKGSLDSQLEPQDLYASKTVIDQDVDLELEKKEEVSFESVEWRIEVADEDVKIEFKQGNCYDGRVSNKFMEGKGKYRWTDGSVYEGEFEDGQITGRGRLDWPDLSWYEGEFYCGYRHGTGTFVCSAAHTIYIGHWFMGHKNGEGILYYSDNLNDFYDGDWVMDVRHGEGIRKYPSGSCYIGEWLNGVRHGLGTMIWPDNHLYRGHWKNGFMDGYGEYTWGAFLNPYFAFPMENIYRGCWKTGVRQGHGILELAGGGIYRGWWENNAKCGAGMVICQDGHIEYGDSLFYADRPIIKRHISAKEQEMVVKKKCKKRFKKCPAGAHEKCDNLTETVGVNPMRKGSYEILPLSVPVHSPGQAINLQYHIERWEKHYKNEMEMSVILNVENGDQNEQDKEESEISESQSLIKSQEKELKISDETEITEFQNKLEGQDSESKQISAEAETTTLHPKLKSEVKVIKQTIGETEATLSQSKLKYQGKNAKKITNETDKISSLKASKAQNKKAKTARKSISPETSKREGDTKPPYSKDVCIGTYEYEEKWLHNAIIKHLLEVRTVYNSYATLACKEKPNYDAVLVRILLWQLFRDCGIHKRDISLIELDEIFAENPYCLIKNLHNPFELIYFWQYLHILVDLSWILYASKNIGRENCSGVLGSAFQKLILEDILPNAGHHIGSALLDKQSVLPFNATYMFYKSVGEPHTAQYFLNKVCGKIKEQPQASSTPLYIPIYPQHIVEGSNAIGVGGDVMYLPGPEPLTLPSTNKKLIHSERISAETYLGDLSKLHNIGAIGVVDCLTAVCPGIKSEEGLICNIMYPLTFLEFYEVLLLCAEVSIKKDNQRLKRLAALEEQRKLAETAPAPVVEKPEPQRSFSALSTRTRSGKKKRKSEKSNS